MVSSSTLPFVDLHPVPVDIKTAVEAVFANPAHLLQSPGAGTTKFLPMKLVPPLPKPPLTLMQ
jgi:hypothetical protein